MTEKTIEIKQRTANIVLTIGGLNGFVSKEVQNSTSVLRLNFCAKNPAHRQYAKRYKQCAQTFFLRQFLFDYIFSNTNLSFTSSSRFDVENFKFFPCRRTFGLKADRTAITQHNSIASWRARRANQAHL